MEILVKQIKISKADIVKMRQQRFSYNQIAKFGSCSRTCITHIISNMELSSSNGRGIYALKLKSEKVEKCYTLYNQGKSWEEISEITGISCQSNHGWSVQYYVGVKLAELCRKNPSCPTKVLLPETEV